MPVLGDFSDKTLDDFFVSAGLIDSHLHALVLEAQGPICYDLDVTATLQSKASPRSSPWVLLCAVVISV